MAGYGTDEGFAAWLVANGYVLPDTAPVPAILRERGSNYVDGNYWLAFIGEPAAGYSQERAWPRTGAGNVPSDVIPVRVIQASYAAALHEAQNPGALAVVVTPSAAIKREKVGSLEVEYAGSSGDAAKDATPVLSAVEGLLAPFLRPVEGMPMVGLWSTGRC